ncbi:hypothetical protein [Acaryochloris sp. CCMEE 5410]|uniref:hypothetical protein n=1 Tax=Acaryochloris sp. CCMEE 5410 TaxID=310037 RepID=UPI0021D284A4|nr:hypothetical protein [Acaryochloris sp. CCMEE 5410]KAI9129039.1 hypothetical protein ON05_036990 [Acaryochloris sp. CCMEE 5410]
MGRCPKGCPGSLSAPLDQSIGITSYQHSSKELVRLGCLLSLFMPYELASWMLSQWSGLSVSSSSLWNWVQVMGNKAYQELEAQLKLKHQVNRLLVKRFQRCCLLCLWPLLLTV